MTADSVNSYTDAVVIRGARKRFGKREVVRGVDLRVPAGSAYGYLGPNGAGKTTLLRMLLGLLKNDGGEMELLGHSLPKHRSEALRRVGAIVEEPKFYKHLSGRDNLRTAAAARGRETFARIDGALARVGLAARANDRVKTYSLGMRQRLGIARCLLGDPKLLVLDEPMNGLDPAGIQEMRHLIRSFVDEGRTVLLSSHLLDEVEKTCDYIAIVDDGQVVTHGPIDELRNAGSPTVLVEARRRDESPQLVAAIEALAGVAKVQIDDDIVSGAWVRLHVVLDESSSDTSEERSSALAALNRALIEQSFDVRRFEPRSATLEQRFLELTTRLENAS